VQPGFASISRSIPQGGWLDGWMAMVSIIDKLIGDQKKNSTPPFFAHW